MPGAPHRHAGAHLHAGARPEPPDARRLELALGLIAGFVVLEVTAGILAGSLALLSDAGHMLTDAVGLAVALVAVRVAARPPAGQMTFGFGRAEALSAQFNGATLLVLGLLIIYEGVRRLVSPPSVAGTPILVVALVGIVVNLVATWILSGGRDGSMSMEGAFQHVVTDLAAFTATAVAGGVILITGFVRADGIASLLVAAIMLRGAYVLLKASGRVFLEAAPQDVDVGAVGRAMVSVPGVREVHDLHVWEVSSGFPALSAHVLVGTEDDCHEARRALVELLSSLFHIDHVTLQVDHEGGELLSIEPPARR